ncbi:MAG: hypothetical protein H0T73_11780 [Ardenticatenales bacterium]|nr:hypothetical protein [Ardenticatenales bacterium]
MLIEDFMGLVLFIFGLILITLAFLSAINVMNVIGGMTIIGFSILGFILCITGFVMARTVVDGTMSRFRE